MKRVSIRWVSILMLLVATVALASVPDGSVPAESEPVEGEPIPYLEHSSKWVYPSDDELADLELIVESIPFKPEFAPGQVLDKSEFEWRETEFRDSAFLPIANIDIYGLVKSGTDRRELMDLGLVSDVDPDVGGIRVGLTLDSDDLTDYLTQESIDDFLTIPGDDDEEFEIDQLYFLWPGATPPESIDSKIEGATEFVYGGYHAVPLARFGDAGIATLENGELVIMNWPKNDLMLICRRP